MRFFRPPKSNVPFEIDLLRDKHRKNGDGRPIVWEGSGFTVPIAGPPSGPSIKKKGMARPIGRSSSSGSLFKRKIKKCDSDQSCAVDDSSLAHIPQLICNSDDMTQDMSLKTEISRLVLKSLVDSDDDLPVDPEKELENDDYVQESYMSMESVAATTFDSSTDTLLVSNETTLSHSFDDDLSFCSVSEREWVAGEQVHQERERIREAIAKSISMDSSRRKEEPRGIMQSLYSSGFTCLGAYTAYKRGVVVNSTDSWQSSLSEAFSSQSFDLD